MLDNLDFPASGRDLLGGLPAHFVHFDDELLADRPITEGFFTGSFASRIRCAAARLSPLTVAPRLEHLLEFLHVDDTVDLAEAEVAEAALRQPLEQRGLAAFLQTVRARRTARAPAPLLPRVDVLPWPLDSPRPIRFFRLFAPAALVISVIFIGVKRSQLHSRPQQPT